MTPPVHVPFAPVKNAARLAVPVTLGGRTCINVFHIQQKVPTGDFWTSADLKALADGVANAYKAQFLTEMSNQCTLQPVTIQDLSDIFGSGSTSTVTGTGGDATQVQPNNVALAVSWKIARRYRGGHPRTYLAGLCQSAIQSPTTVNAAKVTGLTTKANAFLAAVNALSIGSVGPVQLVCIHYFKAKVPLTTPLVDPITSGSVNSRIDSQRRRLGK